MTLVADRSGNEPGLWSDPAWQPGQPATFAVVIGVSRYRHLKGGPDPIADNDQAWLK
jgi:hypothetical protein